MLKILIVDDHALVRQGLKQVLSEEFESAILGEAGSAQGMVEAFREQEWDAVVLDINLPERVIGERGGSIRERAAGQGRIESVVRSSSDSTF